MQHLREVQGFRSAVLELANLLFSFRDSDSPTAPTKGAHGGAPHATDVHHEAHATSFHFHQFSAPGAQYRASYTIFRETPQFLRVFLLQIADISNML